MKYFLKFLAVVVGIFVLINTHHFLVAMLAATIICAAVFL